MTPTKAVWRLLAIEGGMSIGQRGLLWMESTRQSKIARLIQKELSEIFLLQAKSMNGVLVSVTSVRVSPDLSIARAYISVFPSERGGEIVKNLSGNMRAIRFELGGRLRHQLRIIPELKFFLDDSRWAGQLEHQFSDFAFAL